MSVNGECQREYQIVRKTVTKARGGGEICLLAEYCAQRGERGCQSKPNVLVGAFAEPGNTLQAVATNFTNQERRPCIRNIH